MHLIKPLLVSDELEALLASVGLPVSDIRDAGKVSFFGIVEEKQLNGVIGVEKYSTVGLLRSLAVSTAARKAGYGIRLVQMLEDWSGKNGIDQLYLLTTDAVAYFEKLNYGEVSRDQVPRSIMQTSQFSSLCPSTAIVMCKNLSGSN